MAGQSGRTAERPREFGVAGWRSVGKRVVRDTGRDNLSVVAAGVAYYAFLALFPALLALVSIYGLVANPSDVQRMVSSMSGVMPADVVSIISGQLQQLTSSTGGALGAGAVLGILVALWSATKGTKSIMTGLNIAYDQQEARGFFKLNAVALGLTLAAIVGVVLACALVIAAPAVLESAGLPGALRMAINWARWPVVAALVIVGLGVLYRYGPSRSSRGRWVGYGSVVATALWLIASGLFSWYVSNFGSYNKTYGSLAAVVILLFWFYISAYVILLGAELDSEVERQLGRGGRPPAEEEDQFKA